MLRSTLKFLVGGAVPSLIASALAVFVFGSLDPKFRQAITYAFLIDFLGMLLFIVAGAAVYFALLGAASHLARGFSVWLQTWSILLGCTYSILVRCAILFMEHSSRE